MLNYYMPILFRLPLWSRGNIVTSHAAGTGSIPSTVNFLVEVFPVFSLNLKTNVRKFGPHSSPVIKWPSNIIRLRTAMISDPSCSTWPSLNQQQKRKKKKKKKKKKKRKRKKKKKTRNNPRRTLGERGRGREGGREREREREGGREREGEGEGERERERKHFPRVTHLYVVKWTLLNIDSLTAN